MTNIAIATENGDWERVSFPINSMVILQFVMFNCERVTHVRFVRMQGAEKKHVRRREKDGSGRNLLPCETAFPSK